MIAAGRKLCLCAATGMQAKKGSFVSCTLTVNQSDIVIGYLIE
jgi:hypothetical protein